MAESQVAALTPERIAEIDRMERAASPAPWAWARTSDQGFDANVGHDCFAEDDTGCTTPLAGDLTDRRDDFNVGEGIAHLGHQSAQYDAALIVAMRNSLRALLDERVAQEKRIAELEKAARAVTASRKLTDNGQAWIVGNDAYLDLCRAAWPNGDAPLPPAFGSLSGDRTSEATAQCESVTGGGRYRCAFEAGHKGLHRAAGIHNTWSDPDAGVRS